MKTGRSDLDAMLRVTSIPADEPTFLLRAQDLCAAPAVRDWAARQINAGTDKAVVEQALRQADAMYAWPVKKLPGADHLTEAQRLRLGYAYDRRQRRELIERVAYGPAFDALLECAKDRLVEALGKAIEARRENPDAERACRLITDALQALESGQ